MVASFDRLTINTAIRVRISLIFFGIFFLLLVLRLWYLQIVYGDYFRNRSENNRLRTIYIPAPRGLIVDRQGEVLVQNRPAFHVTFVREDSPDPEETLRRLADILEVTVEDLMASGNRMGQRRRFQPRVLARDISRKMLAKVLARKFELPGVSVDVVPTREYVYGDSASHVVGYIREISANQLETSKYSGYRMGDLIGQYGVERQHEYLLRGKRGVERVIVNARGTRIGKSFFETEHAGHEVTLTLDHRLQKIADDYMAGKKGAVVMMDARSGELLVLGSYPSFDPNIFSNELTSKEWSELSGNPDKPLTDRATQGLYPPGSVFKIVTASGALTEGITSPAETVFCGGTFRVGNSRPFHCHNHGGHGRVDMKEAFKKSCNVYFYTLGQRLGIDRLYQYASAFGLGSATGLAISEEPTGLVPSQEWKRTHFSKPEDQRWYPGETPSVSIGQGATMVTPLQIARLVAVVANGGRLVKPHIVQGISSFDGLYKDTKFVVDDSIPSGIPPWVLEKVRSFMHAVVNEEGGTGRRAQLDTEGLFSAGKTGTAQRRSVAAHQLKSEAQNNESLAWFAGFAPTTAPEVVVAIIIEGGGHGGVTAAPLAKTLWDTYFELSNKDIEKSKGGHIDVT
ncbi:MAG: penicillin-binding protein 2 [Bdellovibrionales bacterium]|nr:penicillin-binding protein 2 [Bdellovibrionales bacterium]